MIIFDFVLSVLGTLVLWMRRLVIVIASRTAFILKRCFPDLWWAATSYRSVPAHYASNPTEIRAAVLTSESVVKAIGNRTQLKYDEKSNGMKRDLNLQRKKEAEHILDEMMAKPSIFVIRVFAFFLRKVWRILYYIGVHYGDAQQISELREAVAKGPVVLLPTHKSHVDYLLITCMCFELSLPIPHVVAGDNLNIPIIGALLRRCGAFFIRRSFSADTDPLYAAIFREYVKQLLANGHSVECYIEGGRSRSGKLLPPKIGVLRCLVDAIMDDTVTDVSVVPISLSYDRIVENDSYIEELSGGFKKKERLFSTLRRLSSIISNSALKVTCFGSVDVRIASPFSLREYVQRSPRDGDAMDSVGTIRKRLAYSVGYRVLYECNRVSVVLPAALVGTILLTHYQRGISRETLLSEVVWLRKEIISRGGKVADLTADSINLVVELVLGSIIGQNHLVKRHKDRFLAKLYNPKERLELSLLKNQLIHHFVSEGIAACAMYAIEKKSKESPVETTKEKLLAKVRYLSQLLKLEFIYKPSPSIQQNFDQTIEEMMRRKILRYTDDGKISVNEDNGVEKGTSMYLFLCSLFWEFLDSYWLTALGLLVLLPDRVMRENVLLSKLQAIGETLYFEGQLDLYEAISKETLQNALTLYETWGIIEFINVEGQIMNFAEGAPSTGRIVRLRHLYQSADSIEKIVFKIGKYRKRSEAYRSRRYALSKRNDVLDAIMLVKKNNEPNGVSNGHVFPKIASSANLLKA
eukprot:TRINITY_DN8189_c0_g1_i1.p1 TRINITY_DN8189_c0_g1~~TRINITY_DN8189_c0_g1_i1.p1  ORF type:complete len:750 (-),score=120.10 TRINITY_DN8189_c0_g1_i1:85-2334(-)